MSQEKKHAFIHWQLPPEFSIHWPFAGLIHYCLWAVTAAYASDAVNINTASIEVLAEELVGVGPELAKRIVDFSERYGGFKSLGALGSVRGIGPSLLTKNEGKIVIE